MGIEDFYDSKRVRAFKGVFYPDSDTYDYSDVMQKISSFGSALFILHDKDLNDEGEVKKAHYHFVVRWTSGTALYRSSIANLSGLSKMDVIPIYGKYDSDQGNSLEQSLLYLTHRNYPEKVQYSDSDLLLSYDSGLVLYNLYKGFLNDKVVTLDSDALQQIRDFIVNQDFRVTSTALLDFLIRNDFLAVYRRYYHLISNIQREHNDFFYGGGGRV